jgi:hypothetical protein
LQTAEQDNTEIVVLFSPEEEKVKAGIDGQPNNITDLLIANSDINYPEGMEPRVAVGLATEAYIDEHPKAKGIIDKGQKLNIPAEITVEYTNSQVKDATDINVN